MLFVVIFVFFAVAMLGMAIGVICGRQALKGSCGRDCSCRSNE